MRYAVVEVEHSCDYCPYLITAGCNQGRCSKLKRTITDDLGVSLIPDDCPLPQNTARTPIGKIMARCYY